MSLSIRKFAFGLCVFSVPAMASEVRVSSMGRPAGLDDESYVFAYPSNVTRYSLAIAEVGNASSGEAYAAVMTQMSGQSLGVALSRDQSLFTYRNSTTLSTDVPDFLTGYISKYSLFSKYNSGLGYAPERPIDLFYGMALGTDSGFGVRLTLAGNTHEAKIENTLRKSAEQVDVHLGYHMPVAAGRLDLALKVGAIGRVQTSTANAGGAKTLLKSDRGIEGRFLARYAETGTEARKPFVKVGVDFMQPTVSQSMNGETKSRKAKEISVDVQGGLMVAPNEKSLFSIGMGGFYFKNEGPFVLNAPAGVSVEQALEQGTETAVLNLGGAKSERMGYGMLANLGGEALLSDRWGMMLGLDYVLWGRLRSKDGFSSSKPTYTSNLTATGDADLWSFGAFYEIKTELRLDASVALKDFVHKGPNFLTGGTTTPFVPQFSGVYKF